MSPSVTCYPTPNKPKARKLLDAFAAGAGGAVDPAAVQVNALRPGAAAFYGVVPETRPLWLQAKAEGRDWYYLDNAYFDTARGTHFRVTKNALQARGDEKPDWTRLAALKLDIQPWTRKGGHIVVVEQSNWFLSRVSNWEWGATAWLAHVLHLLPAYTVRPVVVRRWNRDKGAAGASLRADLQDAWALVTHSSAAANEALLAGVPVFCTGPCSALWMGSSDLAQIESPRRPDGRMAWAAALAGRQWTIEELRSGAAWRGANA